MNNLTTKEKTEKKTYKRPGRFRVCFDYQEDEAALIRSAAELDNRTVTNFVAAAPIKVAKMILAASTLNQHFIVYRAIQSGANTAEDVRLITGLDKPTIALCLSELETLNSLRSETGKGNRTTLWFLTERPAPIKRRPLVMDDDF